MKKKAQTTRDPERAKKIRDRQVMAAAELRELAAAVKPPAKLTKKDIHRLSKRFAQLHAELFNLRFNKIDSE